MRHVNNDPSKILIQNALIAQQVAEAAKNRQADRARAQSVEDIEELHEDVEEQTVKKVAGNTGEDKSAKKERPRDQRNWRYRKDGTLEDGNGNAEGPGSLPPPRIDIKA